MDVNCQVADGWNQFGPLHPDGTRYENHRGLYFLPDSLTVCRKYYRTLDNCYVSVNTVEDLAQKAPAIPPASTRPTNLVQESLPYCGPVPHLKAVNRPGLLEGSPPLPPLAKPAISPALAPTPVAPAPQYPPKPAVQNPPTPPKPAAQKPQGPPKLGTAKTIAPNLPPALPRSTSTVTMEEEGDDEESDEEEESPSKLVRRTVSIIRAPSASCRTCPRAWCKAAERLNRRQKTEVHCSTTPGSRSQFLRTMNSCYVHGRDTDLSIDEGR